MPARRLPLALLAPVSLLLLVVALGALQYRWVGQVSEGEREQLKQSLDRRSREFADDFDREIGRAYQIFRPAAGFTPAAPGRFSQQYEEWHATARFPGMLKTAYFAMQSGNDIALHRYSPDSHAFETLEWPDALQPVRTRLTATLPRTAPAGSTKSSDGVMPAGFVITTLPVMPDIPALVISGGPTLSSQGPGVEALHMTPGVAASFSVDLRPTNNYVVLELDRDYVASTVLPALAERHFPENGADRFRIAVVDGKSQVMLARGLPAGQSLDPAKADASAPFFGIRMEMMKGVMTPLTANGGPKSTVTWSARVPEPLGAPTPAGRARGESAVVITRPADVSSDRLSMVIEQHASTIATATRAMSNSGWTVLLQHSAGSLDAAVNRIRIRNLWLSFGILGVLAASAGLVLVNARRSEKLAAQQMDFVATVSHELRTPVAVIRSAAQNLAAGVVHEPEQAKRYGDLIEAEGRRLTDMVEQVLEYAGLSDAKRVPANRPIDAGRLVRDVVAASESLPEAERVTFDVRIDEGAPAVMAEEDSIRRALLNLVGNALKYGADGGWIGISVTRGTGRDEGHVSIAVSDRGRGIPAEDLALIFKPFYRGAYARDRQIHGNGLGLSLVKRIAEAHGGRVSVKSVPNEGSTFTLLLPFASGAVAGTPALADPARPAEGRST